MTALHNPYSDLTPSALAFAMQRRARLARMRTGAIEERPVRPVTVQEPAVVMVETPVEAPEESPKEPWFSIVEELDPPEPVKPSVRLIQEKVAAYYGLSVNALLSARRTKDLILPRHIGMYLSYTLTPQSHPDIARRFGGRDHSVSIYAAQKIERLCKVDWEVAHDVAHLEAAFQ